jgi:hypothetical protein
MSKDDQYLGQKASYPEQFPIQSDDLWLEIVWSALLGQRRLQVHVGGKERVMNEVKEKVTSESKTIYSVILESQNSCVDKGGIRRMYD